MYTVIWDIIMIILSMVLMIPQAMLQWTTLPQLLAYRHTPLMNGYHSSWPTHSLRNTSLRDITYLLLTSLLPTRLVEALQDAAGISRPLSVALLLWFLTNAAFDFKFKLNTTVLTVCLIYHSVFANNHCYRSIMPKILPLGLFTDVLAIFFYPAPCTDSVWGCKL